MNTTLIQEGRRYEYLLVLTPHEELQNRISHVRKEFYEKYKLTIAPVGKPHIMLVKFLQHQMMEESILNRLNIIAMSYHPVKIDLKDYGSLPSHSIYLNIKTKIPIQDLVKEIRHNAQRLMKPDADNKPHFLLEPYIIIAGKLQPWQYEKGWLEYSHKHFTASFIADGMLLLKRPAGEKRYQAVQRFEFKNLLIKPKQGALFM